MHLYGKTRLPELEKALLKFHNPMDCTLPIEVMLCGMEEIKIFLLANPDEERKLTEVFMSSCALIKMVNTGIYGKAIEGWNNLTVAD